MKTIEVKCDYCNKTVLKPKGEHNRRIRLGKTKFYCNYSCASKEPSRVALLKENTSDYDISQHSGSRRDHYSDFRWYMKVVKLKNRQYKGNDLDLEYLKQLWEDQGGICPFTKEKMILRTHTNTQDKLTPYHASLDRIDCSKGYLKGNVRYVSVIANYARNNFSDIELLDFCKRVANNN
jgi:hypothetical protein